MPHDFSAEELLKEQAKQAEDGKEDGTDKKEGADNAEDLPNADQGKTELWYCLT